MKHERSFNPESKFMPVDFQVARLLDYDKMKKDGVSDYASWETPLVYDEDARFASDIDQCFATSGFTADGIWDLIDSYDEEFDDDDGIEEVENPDFTPAQKLGAKAMFMALAFFLGNENNYEKARKRLKDIFSQPHLPASGGKYDWYN